MPEQDIESYPFIQDEEDKLHPFTMIPNDLIRDQSLSPNCRWLITYLLSNITTWNINVRQLINHAKPHMGKNKLYQVLNEACESGYILKHVSLEGNLKRIIYKVSREPKFKKSFPRPENREPENRELENRDYKNTIDKKTIEKKHLSDPPSSAGLTSFFIEKLKEINPKLKDPDRSKWEKEMGYLLTQDNRTEEEVKQVINFAVNHHKNATTDFTWGKNILSPQKLRKQFDSIWIAMTHDSKLKKEKPKLVDELHPDEKWRRQKIIEALANKNRDNMEIYIACKGDHARIQKDDLRYDHKEFSQKLAALVKKYKLKT